MKLTATLDSKLCVVYVLSVGWWHGTAVTRCVWSTKLLYTGSG